MITAKYADVRWWCCHALTIVNAGRGERGKGSGRIRRGIPPTWGYMATSA